MHGVTTDPDPTEPEPSPYKESPWKQLPGERTAFGDEVRRVLGPPNRSTRAIPYLAVFLAVYIAVSIWCQLYVSRHSTNDVIHRIDRLESTIRGLRTTIREEGVQIEKNRKADVAARDLQATLLEMQESFKTRKQPRQEGP